MSNAFRWRAVLVVAVLGGALALVFARPVQLGLDLQGGTQIVLEAQDTPRQKVDGDTASSTVNGADPATLALDPTGSFQASTGCRTVTGSYALDGTRLRLTLDPYDAFGCTDPIGTQDAFVLGFLDGAYDATISGRQLTLSSGERQLVYVAA